MQRGGDDKNLSYALSGVQMVIVPEEAGKSLMFRVTKQSHPAFLGRLLFRKDIAGPVILDLLELAVLRQGRTNQPQNLRVDVNHFLLAPTSVSINNGFCKINILTEVYKYR
jgi:hypothetical protein